MKYISADRLIDYLTKEADREFRRIQDNANLPVLCHFHNGCRMMALDTLEFIKEIQQKPLSTEETELNSLAFLEQMGYTCIPPGARENDSAIKPVEWSEEDEKRIKQLIYDTEHIKAGYEKRKEQLGEMFNDALIKDCDEQID